MKTGLIICLYTIGYVLGYILLKKDLKNSFNGIWTKGDRAFALTLSLTSWFLCLGCIINILFGSNLDEPAKW